MVIGRVYHLENGIQFIATKYDAVKFRGGEITGDSGQNDRLARPVLASACESHPQLCWRGELVGHGDNDGGFG